MCLSISSSSSKLRMIGELSNTTQEIVTEQGEGGEA